MLEEPVVPIVSEMVEVSKISEMPDVVSKESEVSLVSEVQGQE